MRIDIPYYLLINKFYTPPGEDMTFILYLEQRNYLGFKFYINDRMFLSETYPWGNTHCLFRPAWVNNMTKISVYYVDNKELKEGSWLSKIEMLLGDMLYFEGIDR